MHRTAGSDFGWHHSGFTRWEYRPKHWTRRAESSGGSCSRRAPPRRDWNDSYWLAETRREWPDGGAWLLCVWTVNDKASWIFPSTTSILSWFFGEHRWSSSEIFPNDDWDWTAHYGRPKTYETIGSPGTTFLQNLSLRLCELDLQPPICTSAWCINAKRWMTINLWLWRHTRSYVEFYPI